MAVVFNLEINKGAALIETFTIRDADGNARDLTGYEGIFKLYEDYGESVYLEINTINDASKIFITSGTGEVDLNIPNTDISSVPVANTVKFHIDLYKASDGATYNSREIRGNCVVIDDSA